MQLNWMNSMRWLGRRTRSWSSGVHVFRRAAQAFREGGTTRLQQYIRLAAASEVRERRYQQWIKSTEGRLFEAAGAMQSPASNWPLISIIVPCYNTPLEMLEACIESVQLQTAPNWELILVDDCSPKGEAMQEVIDRLAERDDRIQSFRMESNGGISNATNRGLELAKGKYVAFLDHDDELSPFAIQCMSLRLTVNPDLDLIYSDEDKIDEQGHRHTPAFKTAFDAVHLYTSNYICHLLVMRRVLAQETLQGLRSRYDGAQDYDFILRAVEKISDDVHRIGHVPLVLYHWRSHRESTAGTEGAKTYAIEAGRDALIDAMRRQGISGTCNNGPSPCTYVFRPNVQMVSAVDVIVQVSPQMPMGEMERTSVVDAWKAQEGVATVEFKDQATMPEGSSPFVLFVDSTLQPSSTECVRQLIEAMTMPNVMWAGPRILDVGMRTLDAGWLSTHERSNWRARGRGATLASPGYQWDLHLIRAVSAVSQACYMTRREHVVDLTKQDAKSGWAVNVPTAIVQAKMASGALEEMKPLFQSAVRDGLFCANLSAIDEESIS